MIPQYGIGVAVAALLDQVENRAQQLVKRVQEQRDRRILEVVEIEALILLPMVGERA